MKNRCAEILALVVVACLALGACGQRNGDDVAARVKDRIHGDDLTRTVNIEVSHHDGVVTLTGNVDTPDQKEQALALARTTEGVHDVVDRIATRTGSGQGDAPDVDRTAGEAVDDASVTRHVKARLLDDEIVRGLHIDVDTKQGVVYLTGTVRSEQERDRALELARSAPGVRDVQANLKIQRT
jgi:hyperosmotically inducible protein